MALLNILWAIIILACWSDSFMGLMVAAAPSQQLQQQHSAFGLSSRHGNSMMIGGGGGDVGGGMGTAGGGGGLSIPGSISYQPHDSEELEKAVYDPGDELLHALNSEAAAALAASSNDDLDSDDDDDDYIDKAINDLAMPDKFELLRKLDEDIKEEQDIVSKSALLMKFLEDPTIETLPVVYVEENLNPGVDTNNLYPLITGMEKRSRYYRRYPWKRHSRNRGSSYEPEIRYACTPSKEDVFKLLVGLHENRNGNQHKTVHFCNRKRPAKAIFTNIRFLG
ncbi:uncharacterized protein LOC129952178 [Eupeodes corollae]|uniref:uncharacterized protein LOC129952178 n=1 Tax=Eupeodes corollae TaxID=290404 RepID=UPI002490DA9C|nr:uncharacterized protein LOC129952178 [Eupeodes corollae]